MSLPETAVDAARIVVDALERAGLPYAVGGAMAYSLWGVPRTTHDVDIDVFVDESGLDATFAALREAGVLFDEAEARRGHANGGYFKGLLGPYRIDIFTPSIPFSWEAARTRVRAALDGGDAWHLSAESTAVFKLLFYRNKDLVDLERLVQRMGDRLDHAYVRRWMVDMVGEDDKRTETWDDLVRRFCPPPT